MRFPALLWRGVDHDKFEGPPIESTLAMWHLGLPQYNACKICFGVSIPNMCHFIFYTFLCSFRLGLLPPSTQDASDTRSMQFPGLTFTFTSLQKHPRFYHRVMKWNLFWKIKLDAKIWWFLNEFPWQATMHCLGWCHGMTPCCTPISGFAMMNEEV